MVNSKKLLSLFLAVVMILSTFTVMAFAYTVGPEKSGDINYKFTVEKADATPEDEENGFPAYEADNIYAVTLWMQSNDPVSFIQVPVQFNKAHFSPFMFYDGEDVYVGTDTYFGDMEELNCYAYTYGDFMNNTAALKADGSKATTKNSAKCIGIGNSKWGILPKTSIEFMSPDSDLYDKWHNGLTDDQGVMKVMLTVDTMKSAYLNNTEDGLDSNANWNKMVTIYFLRNEDVSEEDVIGDEFGVFNDTSFGVDGVTDLTGSGYYAKALAAIEVGNPNKNVVSNAVIEAAAVPTSIVNPMKGQIRFDKNENGGYAGTFDVRAIARITGTDFDATFGSIAAAKEMITSVGFVFTQGTANYDDMVAVASGESVEGYTYAPVDFISTSFDKGNYTFSCIVDNASDVNESLSAVGYVEYVDANGDTQYAFYTSVQTVTFKTLYDAHYNDAFAA